MKNYMLSMLACVMLASVGKPAHAALLDLGLCDGVCSTTGMSKTGSGTIQVAIVLPASAFARYEGASLSGMRVGLSLVEGISGVQGWVRTSLDGDNLCTATFAEPVVGWNEVSLDAPSSYTLRADQDLVIGYQFEQSKSTKCIAQGGLVTPDCYWVARNGDWQNKSADALGAVSVELVIDGDMVPATNLAIESFSYPQVVPYGEPFRAQVVVRNVARSEIRGYQCEYQIAEGDAPVGIDCSDVVLQYRQRDTLSIVVPVDRQQPDEVLLPMPLLVSTEGDEVADDDRCTLYRSNYTWSYPHTLLMEEFTTEQCANCPRAINTLAQMVNEGYRFAQISHHVGYYTDFLTVNEDKTYLWFYGDEGSFAPAGMFDRTYDPDFYTAGSGSGGFPIFSIGYADSFRPALEKALAMPAFANVDPQLSYDEATRQLSLDVSVEKAPVLDALTLEPRLTVILIEDSIPAEHQAGISSSSFRHRHVYRKCLTDIWGDTLQCDEQGHATVHLEYTLPNDWRAEYVEAVAFVSNYNPDDRNDSRVYNTAVASVQPSQGESITEIRADAASAPHRWYNLMGQPVMPGSRAGIFIKSCTF